METPEEVQIRKEELVKLQENQLFQGMLTQLKQRLHNRRKEQRLVLQKCDKDTALLLEGVQIGIEEALRIYNAQFSDKPKSPTIKY